MEGYYHAQNSQPKKNYIYIYTCVRARACVCIYIVIHVKPNCNRMKTEQVLRNESDPFTSKPRFPSLTLGI